MLNHLTWGQFALVLSIILVIYYGCLLIKYYGPNFLSRKRADQGISEMQLSLFEQPIAANSSLVIQEIDPEVDAIEQLIAAVKTAATTSTAEQGGLATLRHQLKSILQAHPDLMTSPHRPAINELIVSECEKQGQALLTEAEVDLWWEIPDRIIPLPGPAPLPDGWPR